MANSQELIVGEKFITTALVDHKDPNSFIKNVAMFLKSKHGKKNCLVQEQFVRSMLIFSINSSISLRKICMKASSSTTSQLEVIVEKLIEIAENRDDFSKRTRALCIYLIGDTNPENCHLLGSFKRTSSWSLSRRISLYKPPSLIELPSKNSKMNHVGKSRLSLKDQMFDANKFIQSHVVNKQQTIESHNEMFLEMIESFLTDQPPDLYSVLLLARVLIDQNHGEEVAKRLKSEETFNYMFQYFSRDYPALDFSAEPRAEDLKVQHVEDDYPDCNDHDETQHLDETMSPEKSENPIDSIATKTRPLSTPDLLELNQCLALYLCLMTQGDHLASYVLSLDKTCYEQLATKLYPNCLRWLETNESAYDDNPELTFILKMTASMVFTIVDKVIFGYLKGSILNPNSKLTDLDYNNTIVESSEQF